MEPKRPKLDPEIKYVQKDCQEAEIAALKQKLVDMEAKLMRVTAELEQVKNERFYDKINFETEKYELESKYKEQCSELESKYKEQCSELESKYKKQCSELESKYKEQCSELQSENETLHRYLQDLESSNIKSQINLWNTNLNSRTTKVDGKNDDACYINALPNEIILKIFSYLTQNQLGQIARVCKKWNALTKCPVLWSKVNVEIFCSYDKERDTQLLKSFIHGLPSCVTFIKLYFSGCAGYVYLNFEKLCMKLHHICPNVKVLILTHCETSTSLSENINFCTQFLQGLKKLVFRGGGFKDYSGTAELKDNSKIEVLDLYCIVLSPSSKTQFSKLLSLKELRLARTTVEDAWFVGDVSLLNQLQVLDLGWKNVTASTFRAIQRHGQNLRELYLCDLKLFDRHLNFSNPHLKTICLSGTHVTCEGVVSLLRSFPSLVNVHVDERVARSVAKHPFVAANKCKSGIVKSIHWLHNHNVDYLYS